MAVSIDVTMADLLPSPMDRTFVCNLGKLVLQRRVNPPLNGDDSLETIIVLPALGLFTLAGS
jgi:hypothetical protein